MNERGREKGKKKKEREEESQVPMAHYCHPIYWRG
jgi:hypothetical protein